MNWDQIDGKWKQLKGAAKQHWGKLTDDDLDVIAGKRDALVGKIQERYGIVKEEAQRRADEWMKTLHATEADRPMMQSESGRREQHHASGKR